jgi:PAS domain S-box-containing protein
LSASDVKAHRDRRRETASHVRAVLDTALDAVISMDATGRVTFWNPRAEQIFGWSRDEAVGRPVADLIIPPGMRAAHQEGLARYLRTGDGKLLNRRIEMTAMRKDGSAVPVELALVAVKEGDYHTFSAFLRDITERKRAEAERDRLLVAAEKARTDAEAASRAKDEFLATLSHELRTPLTSIVGWVYLLRSGRLDAAGVARGLETIDRNAMLQAQLVSDILDMSRIISARFRLNVRPVELAPVVAAAIDSLVPAAAAKGIRLHPVLDPSVGVVLGDVDRLQQVVFNLLSNAIKFTPQGGRVQVKLARADGHVEIMVEDTGPGIRPEVLPHVFELFRQGDSSNTRAHGGLGLGLAVVRQLVELHGGTVHATSAGERSGGAVFTIRLPLAREEAASGAPVAAPPTSPRAGPRIDGLRVLVADRGNDVREVVAGILGQAGAEVLTASSARETLETVTRERPDVLVLDLDLGDESGSALMTRIRALPADAGGRTPAAALSAMARTEDRVQSLLAGFQIHLCKPIHPTELVTVVASLGGRIRRG